MATIGEKELKRSWPNEKGLIAGTTRTEGRTMNLVSQSFNGKKSIVRTKDKKGL